MICFPGKSPPSEVEMLRIAKSKFSLTDVEIEMVKGLNNTDDQKNLYKELYLEKIDAHKQLLRAEERKKEEKIKWYFEQKVGKESFSPTKAMWAIRHDFFAFADKKGGWIQKISVPLRNRVEIMEE